VALACASAALGASIAMAAPATAAATVCFSVNVIVRLLVVK
jgi:hypothetical protein